MLRALLISIFLLLSACGVDDTVQTITGKTMGTTYTVKTVGNGVSKSEIEHVLNQVNHIFNVGSKLRIVFIKQKTHRPVD